MYIDSIQQDGPRVADPHPGLSELIATVARLRATGGCPWDAEQTHESLVQYLVEECWELVDAIESGSREDLLEELGDVLYQVLFHSDIASQTTDETFTIDDVARRMNAKMVSRHPHVFGDVVANTPDEVMSFWEDLKSAEKPERSSVLDGIPQGMPALALAQKVLGKADKVAGLVLPAAVGSIPELPKTEAELGKVLLSFVAHARRNGFDAERALRSELRELQNAIREAERS